MGKEHEKIYEQALQDSKACLIDIYIKSKNKKTNTKSARVIDHDFFDKVSSDLKFFNTWVEYSYAIVKQQYSYTNKKHFYKFIEKKFFKP